MKVFRYEHPNTGEGPYSIKVRDLCCGGVYECENCNEWYDLRSEFTNKHNNSITHPGWYQDFGASYDNPGMFSGFVSREQAYEWFDGFVEDLERFGFQLLCFEVPKKHVEIGLSGRQLRFKKDQAAKKERE